VRSKLSGLYQVYATARNIYPRPIPTPIKHLRPSLDTCEQCHWPDHFHGARQRSYWNYPTDGGEDPWVVDMLLEIGGGDEGVPSYSRSIHWHVSEGVRVEYIARDERRQDIPWVRLTAADGSVTVFTDTENPPSEELLAGGEVRTMDCIDCHNRPSHIYVAPRLSVNRAMAAGRLDPSLPEIKFLAVELLAVEYGTRAEALEALEAVVFDFYTRSYPDLLEENRPLVEAAAASLQDIYNGFHFPEMKVRWDVYPDNSGHLSSPGCFRCHAGQHFSEQNELISSECDTCHLVLRQGFLSELGSTGVDRQGFIHPLDEEVIDYPTLCHECHDGALGLSY
jgi:hypothetical protein